MKRRLLLQTAAAAALPLPALAQSKPEKLVYVGDNGPWHYAMVEEVAPAFEQATGIKIDFTLLPVDPWRARLRAELGAGSAGIDIVQLSQGMAGWLAPHMEDHTPLLPQFAAADPDFDWDDFLTGSKKAATYDGKLVGIPYRITTGIMHYQKALFAAAGFGGMPDTWDGFLKAAIALNHPPERYGFGMTARQGAALYSAFSPWLFSNGGRFVDFQTGEIFVNDTKGIEALTFWSELVTKYQVVPPDSMTWEFDEIVANGQKDRYAMTETFAPYGTLINDPKVSTTGGRWAWATVPGPQSKDQSRTWIDGHFLGVPKYTPNKPWAVAFIALACSKKWQKRAMVRGNAPPRRSVLEDPEMVAKIGWTPVAAAAIETGVPTPANPVWDTLELQLRSGLSQALLGQKTAKAALDGVVADWQRSLRRAGVGR